MELGKLPPVKESISFVVVGCGARGRTYMRIAMELGHKIVGIADTSETAIEVMKGIAGNDNVQVFSSGEELLMKERMADVALISTQDAQHFGHASEALKRGYDVLLEKPAAQTSEDVEELARLAEEKGRRLILCFVLRYTALYRTVKEQLDKGVIGEIMTMEATEGVGPWHNCHSYIRGKWSKTKKSTPMIIAKCSHDTDLLAWFAGSHAVDVTSQESISHFRPDQAPAGATLRCTDGCPHVGECRYDAHRYLGDQRRWMRNVMAGGETMNDEAIKEWLRTSDWGRCVYFCDQDTPDHQIVGMKFANGITASLTMTAFDTGRRIRIYGTTGVLEGGTGVKDGEAYVRVQDHEGEWQDVEITDQVLKGYEGHGGGDFGLIAALPELLKAQGNDFVEGHRIGFTADRVSSK